jgi:hypothetical protein
VMAVNKFFLIKVIHDRERERERSEEVEERERERGGLAHVMSNDRFDYRKRMI